MSRGLTPNHKRDGSERRPPPAVILSEPFDSAQGRLRERRISKERAAPVARGFGEILRRPACGGPPQDDKGRRGDFLNNDMADGKLA
jgi:hypothetical protein